MEEGSWTTKKVTSRRMGWDGRVEVQMNKMNIFNFIGMYVIFKLGNSPRVRFWEDLWPVWRNPLWRIFPTSLTTGYCLPSQNSSNSSAFSSTHPRPRHLMVFCPPPMHARPYQADTSSTTTIHIFHQPLELSFQLQPPKNISAFLPLKGSTNCSPVYSQPCPIYMPLHNPITRPPNAHKLPLLD